MVELCVVVLGVRTLRVYAQLEKIEMRKIEITVSPLTATICSTILPGICYAQASRNRPNFNPLSSLLFWDGITPQAYDDLNALCLARALIYYDYKLTTDLLDSEYFRSVWDKAIASDLKWAGFHRLQLSDEERKYYISELT